MKRTATINYKQFGVIEVDDLLKAIKREKLIIFDDKDNSYFCYDSKTGFLLTFYGGAIYPEDISVFGPNKKSLGELERILQRYVVKAGKRLAEEID